MFPRSPDQQFVTSEDAFNLFKFLMLLERRPGIEDDELVRYIQNDYLAGQSACLPYVKTLRSNFVTASERIRAAHITDIPPSPSYHVILENWVEDGDLDRLRFDLRDSKVQAQLQALGEKPLLSGRSRALGVEPRETAAGNLGSAQGARDDGTMIKQIANIRSLPGMSYTDFVSYYETRHAVMAARLLPAFAKYVRNFVLPDPLLQADLNGGRPMRPEFDVMTQMWFRDAAAYGRFARSFESPGIAQAFAEDESKLFDRTFIQIFNVRERLNSGAF